MTPVATTKVPPTTRMRRRERAPTSTLMRKSRTDRAHGLTASSPPRTTASSGMDTVRASTVPTNGSAIVAAAPPSTGSAPAGVGAGVAVASSASWYALRSRSSCAPVVAASSNPTCARPSNMKIGTALSSASMVDARASRRSMFASAILTVHLERVDFEPRGRRRESRQPRPRLGAVRARARPAEPEVHHRRPGRVHVMPWTRRFGSRCRDRRGRHQKGQPQHDPHQRRQAP